MIEGLEDRFVAHRSFEELLRVVGPTADLAFDAMYPDRIRESSPQFWTPVHIARRAAEMLVGTSSARVLDVGSGPGKFCIVGALTTPARFVGIEHRDALVDAAELTARRTGATRATFVRGVIETIDWSRFDAFYFYNPFAESQYLDHYDRSVDLTMDRRRRDVAFALERLDEAAPGTRVVTYHGLGREMPRSYDRVHVEFGGSDLLELWVRR